MPSRCLLALAIALACGHAQATTSECHQLCETRYKACVSDGKMSRQQCWNMHERCRKDCNKKEGTHG